MKYSLSIFTTILVLSFLLVQPAQAQSDWSLGSPIMPDACTNDVTTDECGVLQLIESFIHLAQWILAIIGALSLGYFVYGGFMILTAAGNSSKVDNGRRILAGTVVGLALALGAFQLVRFTGRVIGGGSTPAGFDEYLDTSGGDSGACGKDGDPCTYDGQRVYACKNNACSGQSLCEYWKSNGGGPQGVTASHVCLNTQEPGNVCKSNSVILNYCGGPKAVVCCIKQ